MDWEGDKGDLDDEHAKVTLLGAGLRLLLWAIARRPEVSLITCSTCADHGLAFFPRPLRTKTFPNYAYTPLRSTLLMELLQEPWPRIVREQLP